MTELWKPAQRTRVAESVLAAAEADRAARPDRFRLDPDHLASVAVKRSEDADLLPAGWREGLVQYLASASEDGRLNALGVGYVCSTAIGRLRAAVSMARRRASLTDPERRLIEPPIVITGGWRTGTTFLFRLLATDPRLRAPLPAELVDPVTVADLDDEGRARFLEAASATHELLHQLNPTLRSIHDSGALLAEECVLGMGTDLRNWGFSSTVRLDGYTRWLAEQNLAGTYRRYRHVIETLDRGDGRRWVLKAPAHLAELDHLVETFPGAVVVHLHRDIVETVASGASLFATFRSTYSDEVDPRDVGRFQADQTELWLRRAAAYRSVPSADATFLDVEYHDLLNDPVSVLRRVYAAADLDPPGELDAFVAGHQRSQPRHAHGTHRYSAAAFGLDEHDLRDRFAFVDGAFG